MDRVERLKKEFEDCQKTLTAIGDETRQKLLLLMVVGNRRGIRVSEITENMHITRPAVSHHMQILKDSGMIKSRKEGKYIYYTLNSGCEHIDALLHLLDTVKDMIKDVEE